LRFVLANIKENLMPAEQRTIAPKTFGATSSTDEVLGGVRLNGKRGLVTGVSAGLGIESARALVAHGADVVGAARDLAKAKRATAGVNAVGGNRGEIELVKLDLASLDSVRVCADALVDEGRPFNLVIAKALWAKSEEMVGERF
jgi:NAD(P)-dependent dehydrogenase (short-subunit alcohol dehydrogenase family)